MADLPCMTGKVRGYFMNLTYWKDLQIKYISIVLLLLACILFLLDRMPGLEWLLVLIEIPLIFYLANVFHGIARKRMNTLYDIMNEQCQIAEFIEQYSARCNSRAKHEEAIFVSITIATAYMYLGNFEKAKAIFVYAEPTDERYKKNGNRQYKNSIMETRAIYHGNFATACIRNQEKERAEMHMAENARYLEQLKSTAGKNQTWKQSVIILERASMARNLEFAMEFGEEIDFAEAEAMLQQEEPRIKANMLSKVYNRYLLYRLYVMQGKMEEAGECREFIRCNGGDSWYVSYVNGDGIC